MSDEFVFARDNFEAVLRRAEEHMTARDAMLLRQNIKQLKDMVGIWDDELTKKTAECDVLKSALERITIVPTALAGAIARGDACSQMKTIAIGALEKIKC